MAMVPLHDDGTVTLIHQFRGAVGEAMWEIPAGMRDVTGEPTEETAQRELAEEVGLRAGRLEHVARFHNSVGFSDEAVVIYLATELTEVPDDRQEAVLMPAHATRPVVDRTGDIRSQAASEIDGPSVDLEIANRRNEVV